MTTDLKTNDWERSPEVLFNKFGPSSNSKLLRFSVWKDNYLESLLINTTPGIFLIDFTNSSRKHRNKMPTTANGQMHRPVKTNTLIIMQRVKLITWTTRSPTKAITSPKQYLVTRPWRALFPKYFQEWEWLWWSRWTLVRPRKFTTMRDIECHMRLQTTGPATGP